MQSKPFHLMFVKVILATFVRVIPFYDNRSFPISSLALILIDTAITLFVMKLTHQGIKNPKYNNKSNMRILE